RMPRGSLVSVATAPIVAAMALGGPVAVGWVALIGTTELREIRGKVPWYGTAANHAGVVLPALIGGLIADWLRRNSVDALVTFITTMFGAAIFVILNMGITSLVVSLRTQQSFKIVALGDWRGISVNAFALAPLAWLMSVAYPTGWWASLLFALPLYTTRVAYHRFVEMREMFTQTIGALAEAVDKRDPFTSKHSHRVKQIGVDIGREMRVSASELEALEWGGLLHDVGKIGVPDAVLLKSDRLTREERMTMNAHPVLGAQIIAPVTKLAPELPIIRHHHEWYNGSGYPDRLIGDEIPKLARILHVADAFEAMTAARPYRMTPLTPEQALAELRKFAGIQFDPTVVDAFIRTPWVHGVADAGQREIPRQIPLIGQAANQLAQARVAVGPGGVVATGPGGTATADQG
ncbi:MAG TPA: HD-GYP domain-containing protein, partial [Candidatus Limnocylindrales bacterium]|nr:HD-GYP domain-containing protein [Candidatus Limnocylindrales bacterium]